MIVTDPAHDQGKDLIEALHRDPPVDRLSPAQTLPQAIPSGGVNLNAVLYTASGAGAHPTVLLLHGLPGNEQNIDLAQTLRRAGWNVLTIHYRGSWGGPGIFSFGHCLEDAAAALNWMQNSADDQALKIDPDRIVVIGHSMGGFVAANLLATQPGVRSGAMISGVDLGGAFGSRDEGRAATDIDEHVGFGAGLHILAGTSAATLAAEAQRNAGQWRLASYAARLADRQLLTVTSDDGFASGSVALTDAILASGGARPTRRHFATDHSYSDCRIALQMTVLRWLARLA